MSSTTSESQDITSPRVDIVVVGGSTGALQALESFLRSLPLTWRLPIAVVVHLPRQVPSGLPAVLSTFSPIPVIQAEDKQPIAPGTIYVGPPDYHLLVDDGARLALSVDEPVKFSIPSIDVLFESAAASCGPHVGAIMLSGASDDGAAGLAAICAAGGVAIVQRPAEAAVATMPLAALDRCPTAAVLNASEMAGFLSSYIRRAAPLRT